MSPYTSSYDLWKTSTPEESDAGECDRCHSTEIIVFAVNGQFYCDYCSAVLAAERLYSPMQHERRWAIATLRDRIRESEDDLKPNTIILPGSAR